MHGIVIEAGSAASKFARRLESGSFDGGIAQALELAWKSVVAARGGVRRKLAWSEDKRVIAVGGATLGGSGKTPLALACAASIANDSADRTSVARVAIVGHGYGASLKGEKFVERTDSVLQVGDEALACAQWLDSNGLDVKVAVAGERSRALSLALSECNVAVLDGIAQTLPKRANLALLAVDDELPWGAGACPPRGDLRAPVSELVDASDRIVRIIDELCPSELQTNWSTSFLDVAPSVRRAWVRSKGVRIGQDLVAWNELAKMRVGLRTSVARPVRILRFLVRRGTIPIAMLAEADHRAVSNSRMRNAEELGIDVWIGTAKCSVHSTQESARIPLGTIDYELELDAELKAEILTAVAPS